MLPADWFSEITVGVHERGVLWRDGRPVLVLVLGPGTDRYGKVDDTLRVQVFSVLDAMPELSKELANVIPKDH